MKKYTPEEDAVLEKYYKKITSTEIIKRFLPHRTNRSLLRRAQTLGITGERSRVWTEDDIKRMKELIDDYLTLAEIAEELDRTKSAVKIKYHQYGWKIRVRTYRNKYQEGRSLFWTQEEVDKLIDLAGDYKMRVVAKKLNKSIHSVEIKSSKLGLSFRQGIISKKEACIILNIADRTLVRHLRKLRLFNLNKHITDPDVLSKVAQSILDNNRSLGKCKASIKHLEAVARGDFDCAGVAQLAEQLICNQQVAGSSPIASSNMIAWESGV